MCVCVCLHIHITYIDATTTTAAATAAVIATTIHAFLQPIQFVSMPSMPVPYTF